MMFTLMVMKAYVLFVSNRLDAIIRMKLSMISMRIRGMTVGEYEEHVLLVQSLHGLCDSMCRLLAISLSTDSGGTPTLLKRVLSTWS